MADKSCLEETEELVDPDTFYCPYTNGPECAMVTKGWGPQELCDALQCEKLTEAK